MGLAFVFLVALTFGVGVGLLGGKSQLLFLQDTALGRWIQAEGLWDRAHRWAGIHLLVAALAAIGYHQALERLAGVIPEESSPVAIVALLVLVASSILFHWVASSSPRDSPPRSGGSAASPIRNGRRDGTLTGLLDR
jgi:hypothetical protein